MCQEFSKTRNFGLLKFSLLLILSHKIQNPIIMKQLFLKTTLLLFAITLFNCENNDPEDQLPPITQTGANTFGAIVDGRVFVPKDKTGYSAPGGGRPRGLNISSGEGIITANYYEISAVNYIDTDIYPRR